jgi:asparagine synthetase B (glutamine-hydrolysing)
MCGIFCALSNTHHVLPSEELQSRLHGRGPDSSRTILTKHNRVYITFCSTVLSLRGSKTVTQPLQDQDEQRLLCWNGEAWSIDAVRPVSNDTEAVYELLSSATYPQDHTNTESTTSESVNGIAGALARIAGPYAFVFFDRTRGNLYFGRDFLGRRSLMTKTTSDGDLVISSISEGEPTDGWQELAADGVYCISFEPHPSFDTVPRKFGRFTYTLVPYIYQETGVNSKSVGTTIPIHNEHASSC